MGRNASNGITKPKRVLFNTKTIVIFKIVSAGLFFFGCCLFFFQNMQMFFDIFKHFDFYGFLFLLIFIGGVALICLYITNLVGHIESSELYTADRYDLIYKIVFTLTILAMVVRSFLTKPYLSVPIPIIVICIISGIMTYLTPKIVDNNNDEF